MQDAMREASAKMLETDQENWARVQGLIAVLALPLVREGVQVVEIRLDDSTWCPVEDVAIDAECLLFSWGTNGRRMHRRFPVDRCPPWRQVPLAKRHSLGGL